MERQHNSIIQPLEGEKFKGKLKCQMGREVFKKNETKYNLFNLSLVAFKNYKCQSRI